MSSYIVGGIRVKRGDTVSFWYTGGSGPGTRKVIVEECDESHLYGTDTATDTPKCYSKSKMGKIKVAEVRPDMETDRLLVQELSVKFPKMNHHSIKAFNDKYGVNYTLVGNIFGPPKQTAFIGKSVVEKGVLTVDINGHRVVLEDTGYLRVDGASFYHPFMVGLVSKLTK